MFRSGSFLSWQGCRLCISPGPRTLAADRSVYSLWPQATGCHTYIYIYEEDVRQWYETCRQAADDTTTGATRVGTGGETWALWMWSREKVRGVSHLRDRM